LPSEIGDAVQRLELLDAASRIELYLAGGSIEDFVDDLRTVDAVCMNLIRIGEAARRLAPETRAALPDVPWSEVIGNRDRVAHGYAQLRLDQLWLTATRSVPDLAAQLRNLCSLAGD